MNSSFAIKSPRASRAPLITAQGIWPFILLSSCFAWWGIANNMTDPLVQAFIGIFDGLTTFQSSLIQFAFYGAYFALAIPGSIIARKFGYKVGVLTGLAIYTLGCFLFFPAAMAQQFIPFLIAFYVLAAGLSILETNANPYVLSIGPEESATRRLNLAQSFNPVGSIIGTLLAQILILAKLENLEALAADATPAQAELLLDQQLTIVITPYIIIGVILIAVWILIAVTKMPYVAETETKVNFKVTTRRLLGNTNYVFAVVAQFFYVGAQISVWTFTVFYVPDQLGISGSEALRTFHLPALIAFGAFRFISTAIMGRIKPNHVLLFMAIAAIFFTLVVIFVGGMPGSIALISISACMSLMFPTIFGLGSRGLGEDRKMGGAGLIMAILGGALLTPLQGLLVDLTTVSISYTVPLICFIVIALYAFYTVRVPMAEGQAGEAGV